MLMLDGLGTDFIDAQGATPLENLWTALHLGDYTAYYLAMLYEVDPTPIAALQNLKQELAGTA
jgi:glucose/mannose-6-phosphate isomerase